jgi:hypothetical protein
MGADGRMRSGRELEVRPVGADIERGGHGVGCADVGRRERWGREVVDLDLVATIV